MVFLLLPLLIVAQQFSHVQSHAHGAYEVSDGAIKEDALGCSSSLF